jgi:hypothetical protein
MDALILQKWLTNWDNATEKPGEGITKSPSIITTMINLFLNFGEIDTTKQLYIIDNQTHVCKLMLLIAMITPPWMLFVKPLMLR